METRTVSTTQQLLDALGENSRIRVLVRSGQYRLPRTDDFEIAGDGKEIIGVPDSGPVQIVGRAIAKDIRGMRIDNLCFRAPIEGRDAGDQVSYGCLDVLGSENVRITRCSILGGSDETVSFKESRNCGVYSSLIGMAFEADRNHDMAMLVECDGFELIGCVLCGADRRLPQIQEFEENSLIVISGNRIEAGTTMTLGLKPQSSGFRADIVNNWFRRHGRTKGYLDEIEAVNGSVGVADVYCSGNSIETGEPAGVDVETNAEHISLSSFPHSFKSNDGRRTCYPGHVGPTVTDAWHEFAIATFGSGKRWKDETEDGFPEL